MGMNRNEQDYLVQKIRTQYTERQHTELDELKALDKKVKLPPTVFGYVFGSIAALIMGSGMSLVMTDLSETLGIASPMVPGIAIGLVGMVMTLANFPIYKAMLTSRRKKFADEIIRLSDKISEKTA